MGCRAAQTRLPKPSLCMGVPPPRPVSSPPPTRPVNTWCILLSTTNSPTAPGRPKATQPSCQPASQPRTISDSSAACSWPCPAPPWHCWPTRPCACAAAIPPMVVHLDLALTLTPGATMPDRATPWPFVFGLAPSQLVSMLGGCNAVGAQTSPPSVLRPIRSHPIYRPRTRLLENYLRWKAELLPAPRIPERCCRARRFLSLHHSSTHSQTVPLDLVFGTKWPLLVSAPFAAPAANRAVSCTASSTPSHRSASKTEADHVHHQSTGPVEHHCFSFEHTPWLHQGAYPPSHITAHHPSSLTILLAWS